MSEFRANDGDGSATGHDREQGATGRPVKTATVKSATVVVPPPPSARAPHGLEVSAVADIGTVTTPKRRSLLRTLLRWSFRGIASVTLAFAVLIVAYRFINPPMSALMLLQKLDGVEITRTWVPLERMSPHLVRAVIMSEDAGFCRHYGVDLKELEAAFEQAQDGVVRGGSTISMQTAKNLFLWPQRSYVRKAIEIPLTFGMEAVWSKARMLEIYLNIVEWGPGIFGADAAARYHFNKPASRLTEQEAALLAVTLPAPLVREPGNPSALLAKMGQTIVGRMRSSTRHTGCVLPTGKAG